MPASLAMPITLSFHERMDGYWARGATDPMVGFEEGQKSGTTFGFELTIKTDDLDRFIAEPDHKATVDGVYVGNLFPDAKLVSGTFNFMTVGEGDIRLMEHHHTFTSGGRTYKFQGYKYVKNEPLEVDTWAALTTLYCTILDDTDTVIAAGVTRFPMRDTLKLVRSFEVTGTDHPNAARLRFLKLFLHEELHVLIHGWETYTPPERRRVLAKPRTALAASYDVVIIGSGYGGGVTAARLASWRDAGGAGKSVCVLERGREWRAGDFPDEPWEMEHALRSGFHPTGLLDYHTGEDIDVLVGCGLGGTSLINANVMITPDPSVFAHPAWPAGLPDMATYFTRAEQMLHVKRNPAEPLKAHIFGDAVQASGGTVATDLVPLAVTFQRTQRPDADLEQDACNACGGCVTGCNFLAKNTVDMNYLAIAERAGAQIFTCMEVQSLERQGGMWHVHFVDLETGDNLVVQANQVILSGGPLGSFGVLARSRDKHNLAMPATLGQSFSGNGDVLGFAYNGKDLTDTVDGPTINRIARYHDAAAPHGEFSIEEGGVPRALSAVLRNVLPIATRVGGDGPHTLGDRFKAWLREQADRFGFQSRGALNHSMVFLGMGFENSPGRLVLQGDKVTVDWPDVADQPFADVIEGRMQAITTSLGGEYVKNPRSRAMFGDNLVTVHPLGGCAMGESAQTGVVNHKGEVFGYEGSLYVADGSIVPTALGVNPALTIAALSEWIAERITTCW